MEQKFTKILDDIKQKTNLEIDIFDIFGRIVSTTAASGKNFAYKQYSQSQFKDGIFVDVQNNLTCFSINTSQGTYVGMIKGSDAVSRNYAFMVASLIEETFSKNQEHFTRNDGLKAVLLSEFSHSKVQKLISEFKIPERRCFVIAIKCDEEKSGEIYDFLSKFSENNFDTPVIIDKHTFAYVKFLVSDFDSVNEFAQSVQSSLKNELGIDVNIGFSSATESIFSLAKTFKECQTALYIGLEVNEKCRLHSYREYILSKMIDDIDRPILESYLNLLLSENAQEILDDEAMMNTANEFLNNSLQISETSRVMFMHRNTLVYRLDKIEKSMGLDLRNFSDAITFRLIKLLYIKLRKK